MHGIRRDRTQQSAELRAQRKEREARKLDVYLDLEKRFFDVRKRGDYSHDALEATTRLLNVNPELYSAWNYRRRVLKHLLEQSNQQATDKAEPTASPTTLLQEDLDLTTHALQMYPKVYWIWNHRKWCLQTLPEEGALSGKQGAPKWQRELLLVDKMLERDPRNFHGWNYRRYILLQLAVPKDFKLPPGVAPFPQSLYESQELSSLLKQHHLSLAHREIEYTLSKIESNFSNFSAWHQRSLILPGIWAAEEMDEEARRKARDEEFELVRQAMFVDPDDQSVWTYHQWLVDLDPSIDVLDRETGSINELLEIEPDSRWCMQILAHYYQLYGTREKNSEARALLEKLAVLDKDRQGRYADMISEISSAA